jgi:hypothetical protein
VDGTDSLVDFGISIIGLSDSTSSLFVDHIAIGEM